MPFNIIPDLPGSALRQPKAVICVLQPIGDRAEIDDWHKSGPTVFAFYESETARAERYAFFASGAPEFADGEVAWTSLYIWIGTYGPTGGNTSENCTMWKYQQNEIEKEEKPEGGNWTPQKKDIVAT